MKKLLLQGEHIDFTTDNEDLISVWFQPVTNNFCLMLNAKVIKAAKTFKPINDRLKKFSGLAPLDTNLGL